MDPGHKARDDSDMRIVALILVRVAWLAPTLAGLVAIVFLISPVIPSDPVALLAGETASRAQIELLRQKLGLDRPLPVQLLDYYRQLMSGDLGTSLFTTRPVWDDLSARLPATIELTMAAMIVAVVLGIPLGVVAALYRTRAGVLETLQRPFVAYQRAMGIPAGLIVWKYVLRNSLVSTVTQIGLLFGILLAGTVVIETVFQWPGIGAYAFEAILHSDYAAVMGFTVYAGVVFGIVNLVVDIFQALLDPRGAAA